MDHHPKNGVDVFFKCMYPAKKKQEYRIKDNNKQTKITNRAEQQPQYEVFLNQYNCDMLHSLYSNKGLMSKT